MPSRSALPAAVCLLILGAAGCEQPAPAVPPHAAAADLARADGLHGEEDPVTAYRALAGELMDSIEEIDEILAVQPGGCHDAITKFEAYMNANRDRLLAIFARMRALESDLPGNTNDSLDEGLTRRMDILDRKGAAAMNQFDERCPHYKGRYLWATVPLFRQIMQDEQYEGDGR